MKLHKSVMTSWKTTAAGIATFVAAAASAVTLLLDGNPDTNPEWGIVIAAAVAAFGFIFARDANKSSEEHE